jgi:hypothetical protein
MALATHCQEINGPAMSGHTAGTSSITDKGMA